MANWGGLNAALTAWRNAINQRFPERDTKTDGARADKLHSSTSQHQEDADGTVDAFDMDTNVLHSSTSTGTALERRIINAMKLDFQHDPHSRGYLWIANRQIASYGVDNWRVRAYAGDSPHTEHVHWESRQAREHIGATWPMPNTDALLRELNGDEDVTPEDIAKIAKAVQQAVLFDKVIPDYSQPEKDRRMLSLATFTGYEDFRWKATLAAIQAIDVDESVLADFLTARLLTKLPDSVTQEELNTAVLTSLRELFSGSAGTPAE